MDSFPSLVAYIGNADMIQPDLAPLQPKLDDFMEISGRKETGLKSQEAEIKARSRWERMRWALARRQTE